MSKVLERRNRNSSSYKQIVKQTLEGKIQVRWVSNFIRYMVIEKYFHCKVLYQVIRIGEISGENNLTKFVDIVVPIDQKSWTISGLKEGKTYSFDIGVMLGDQTFFRMHESLTLTITNGVLKVSEQACDIRRTWEDQVSTYSYYEETSKESV